MKRLLLSSTLIFAGIFAFAQQDIQVSHNMFNRLPVNPAYAGSKDAICATMIARNQWTGFEGAPQSGLLNGHMPLGWLPFMPFDGGVGLTILGDKLGFERSFYGKLAFNYRRPIGIGKISAGIGVGMLQKALDGTGLQPLDPDPDPNIPQNLVKDITYDLDFGLYYYTNDLYFGVSSSHLPEQDVDFSDPNAASNVKLNLSLARHYYVMAGYDYRPTANITLKPSTLIKTDAASTTFDANILVEYNNWIWGGVSYRVQDAIVALFGFDFVEFAPSLAGLKFGYAYDITTSKIKGYSSGTHEIMLNYCFKLPNLTPPQRHGDTRFLPSAF